MIYEYHHTAKKKKKRDSRGENKKTHKKTILFIHISCHSLASSLSSSRERGAIATSNTLPRPPGRGHQEKKRIARNRPYRAQGAKYILLRLKLKQGVRRRGCANFFGTRRPPLRRKTTNPSPSPSPSLSPASRRRSASLRRHRLRQQRAG